jgi:hypothetical protein
VGAKKKVAVGVAVVLLAILAYTIFSLPYLFYPLAQRPCSSTEQLALRGSTLFLGDLHIRGSNEIGRFAPLREFIVNFKVRNLVIVGDIFDSPGVWARISLDFGGPEAAQLGMVDVLNLRGLAITVLLVLGAPAHDPQSLDFNVRVGDVVIRTVRKCLVAKVDESDVLALHGDGAYDGTAGFAISWVFEPLTLEREWKTRTGVPPSTWLIMAHTHWPASTPTLEWQTRAGGHETQ